ncbi:putative oxidoreductase [Suhomyces tanzawaensis NRRL Y-17324]|uniref:Putative oxidoreductase n=1 Tax=Suhomyces tanzawaensis NRRL Y-17324 TaxID=984487 RepID=A0A1E4SBY1_9ASCO|nr:putative oxidoreductase [Suhomyces tanzawaensis NRRL Y-17324]ODV77027.1 putative oxidoreductase [Suhomyces tanzawaensis NRRL Y-17324]
MNPPCYVTPHPSSIRGPEKISFVVIGAGLIGPRHAAHVLDRPDCELFAIVDHSAKGPLVAQQLNTMLFQNLDDLFAHCDANLLNYPAAAIVATPNHTHVRMGMQLAARGIHMLMEKPLAPSPSECKSLIAYCHAKNVTLLVGHHRRFNPYIIATKDHLYKLGQLVAIQGTWTLCKPPAYFLEKPWRSSTALGGGTLLINLIHDLDLLQYLLGPIEKVYAELLTKQRTDSGHHDLVDEGAALTLRFENGCCGTFICSDNVTSPFLFEAGTGENPTVPFNDSIAGFYRIFGSHGTLSVPDLKLYHQEHELHQESSLQLPSPSPSPNVKDSPIHRMNDFKKPQPFALQLEHFVNLITGAETAVKCSGDDALRALLCIEAVVKSIETGLPQYVDKIDQIDLDFDLMNQFDV